MSELPRLNPVIRAFEAGEPLSEGYRFLMAAPVRSCAALDARRKLAGRS
jgi:hypothetical protein